MTAHGEVPAPENGSSIPDIAYQQEVLQTMQLSHGLMLQAAGTIDRALVGLDYWRERVEDQPSTYVAAFYSPNERMWRTAIKFPRYDIAEGGKLKFAGEICVPVCEEPEDRAIELVDDCFTIQDAFLLSSLRQELVQARDQGILPHLGCDMAHINTRATPIRP
jgi:hypothetical protein